MAASYDHLFKFSEQAVMLFGNDEPRTGDDVTLICRFGQAASLRRVTWIRTNQHNKDETIATLEDPQTAELTVAEKFEGRVEVAADHEPQRTRTIKLLKVDSNDISKYWCNVVPAFMFYVKELAVKGLYFDICP